MAGRHQTFDAVAVLGYSAIHTVLPRRGPRMPSTSRTSSTAATMRRKPSRSKRHPRRFPSFCIRSSTKTCLPTSSRRTPRADIHSATSLQPSGARRSHLCRGDAVAGLHQRRGRRTDRAGLHRCRRARHPPTPRREPGAYSEFLGHHDGHLRPHGAHAQLRDDQGRAVGSVSALVLSARTTSRRRSGISTAGPCCCSRTQKELRCLFH